MQRYIIIFFLALVTMGCVQQREYEQGNVIHDEKVALLKPGMSRNEVLYIMGEPILQNPFNAERWEYVHQLHKGSKILAKKQVTVYFRNDKVTEVKVGE